MEWTVYQIKSLISNDVYYGCTDNFESRKKSHWNLLKNNNHHNSGLQKLFNENKFQSKEIFEFKVIRKFNQNGAAQNYEEFMMNKKSENINILNTNTGQKNTKQLCISIPYYLYEGIKKEAQKKGVSITEMMRIIFLFFKNNSNNITDDKFKKSEKTRKRTKSRTYSLGQKIVRNIKEVSKETGMTKNEISKKYIELYLEKN